MTGPAAEIVFQVRCATSPGDEVRVVGSHSALGDWDPARGLRLTTSPDSYPLWQSRPTPLPEGAAEYKHVVVSGSGGAVWEERPNRAFEVAADCDRSPMTVGNIILCGSFGDPSQDRAVRQLTLPDSAEARARGHPLLTWQQGGAETVEVWGSFTQPPWGSPVPLHLCPRTGLWWVALGEEFPRLQRGSYEFKFCLDGHNWRVDQALPVREVGGMQNNVLRVDAPLLARIGRRSKASREEATSDDSDAGSCEEPQSHAIPAAPRPQRQLRGAKMAEIGSETELHSVGTAEIAPEAPTLLGRRVVSIGERLCAASMDILSAARSYSQTQLGQKPTVHDLLDDKLAGILYGSDFAFLVDLPEAKRRSGLSLSAGSYYKPKDGAGKGEDSFFVEPPALGVADGVGGLHQVLGQSSKALADEFMAGCRKSALSRVTDDATGKLPSEVALGILRDGWGGVRSYGASTGVVAYMDASSNRLGVALVGDSGVMVVRRPTYRECKFGKSDFLHNTGSFISFKSPEQQHDFNFPYQLCRLPPVLEKRLIRPPDSPDDAVTFDVQVEEGDLVLLYSDGLDDNLHDKEILELCDRALSPYAAHVLGLPREAATSPDELSRALGGAAFLRSTDRSAKTPFAEGARCAGRPAAWWAGGKEDDITCVAAWVTHRDRPSLAFLGA